MTGLARRSLAIAAIFGIGWTSCMAFYHVREWQHFKATGFAGRDADIAYLTGRVGACKAWR